VCVCVKVITFGSFHAPHEVSLILSANLVKAAILNFKIAANQISVFSIV
jgi:hypothetical protein